jgi:hypothetical protein
MLQCTTLTLCLFTCDVRWKQPSALAPTLNPAPTPCLSRPAENEQEDFLLSSYDATCSLAPASARALLADDSSAPMLFTARYLAMGRMPAVVEADVAQERLRLPPLGSSAFAVFGDG